MDDLRRRRQALLRRLPAAISLAYQSLADAGRVPAIAAAAKGTCGGCESPLPESVMEALSHGAVAVCARCERLLRPSEGGN
jgi:predicted  nucleic acid-binding Zn-ribbon protein